MSSDNRAIDVTSQVKKTKLYNVFW